MFGQATFHGKVHFKVLLSSNVSSGEGHILFLNIKSERFTGGFAYPMLTFQVEVGYINSNSFPWFYYENGYWVHPICSVSASGGMTFDRNEYVVATMWFLII